MILLPACAAVEITYGELAGKPLHCGGIPTAACAGGSHQSNAARAQGVVPLPLLPAPDSPLGWSGEDGGERVGRRGERCGRGRRVGISVNKMWYICHMHSYTEYCNLSKIGQPSKINPPPFSK